MELTQGFTPRPRTEFGPPLPVGVAGLAEPAEFWFAEWDERMLEKWRGNMPGGVKIFDASLASGASLNKLCAAASYIIEPMNGAAPGAVAECLAAEMNSLGSLLCVATRGNETLISVTDLERSGASRMVKALAASSVVSGWGDLCIVRTAVGRWNADAARVTPLLEESA
jgi:hypothetical protein